MAMDNGINQATDTRAYIQHLIDKARVAQAEFESYSQEQVDRAVRAIGKIIYDNGEELAQLAVEETGMGKYEDKVIKNKAKAKIVWYQLKGIKSRGIIRYLDDICIVEIAKPIGVIGCVGPTTNPTMTPNQNAMIALKGGNAIVVCPHPRAKRTGIKTVRLMRQALESIGYPVDLIQVIEEPTMEASSLVMQLCDACISTGGAGMVKAAYSSGKPAFGVGAGNVQSLVDRNVDLKSTAEKISKSRTYDNGVLCTCEQCVHVHHDDYDTLVSLLQEQGAAYISREEDVRALREAMFPKGALNKEVVGAHPQVIAAMAGISVPESTRFLLVKISSGGHEEPLSREKLCPVLAICSYNTWEDAVALAVKNLRNEGIGHSSVLHSHDRAHIEYAALRLPVSRVGVNMVGSSGLGGGFDSGLNPTATLGCGTWGNNSLSENLWWHHLVNISRIAYQIPDVQIPTDEEIWSE